MIALLSMFALGIVLGPILKQHDPKAYQRHYAFRIPTSAFLLYGYIRTDECINKIPKERQWVLITLKYLIPTFFISSILMFITAYIAFTN
jgi:hypothetical protein